MVGHTRITKAQFYHGGAFRNPHLIRIMSGGTWAYYQRH